MTELTQAKNETPLAKLALEESSEIVTATLDRFREAGQPPDFTRLLMTVAASCYLSGINSGVHVTLMDAKLAESLVRQNTKGVDFETARLAARRFTLANGVKQDEPTDTRGDEGADSGASGLR